MQRYDLTTVLNSADFCELLKTHSLLQPHTLFRCTLVNATYTFIIQQANITALKSPSVVLYTKHTKMCVRNASQYIHCNVLSAHAK